MPRRRSKVFKIRQGVEGPRGIVVVGAARQEGRKNAQDAKDITGISFRYVNEFLGVIGELLYNK
jgi:hypothetical protein